MIMISYDDDDYGYDQWIGSNAALCVCQNGS